MIASRNLSESQKCGFKMVVEWFENWRVSKSLPPTRDNARAFFFKDVCGNEEVDLTVKFRKTPKRIPTVLLVSKTMK